MQISGTFPALALCLGLALPAQADPAVGFGLSLSFGNGEVDTGVGLRVFSDDLRDSAVASIGVDYMFRSQSWRATLGPAYLGRNAYVGLDLGIGLRDGAFDVGISAGGLDTRRPAAPAPAPAPAPGGGGSTTRVTGGGATAAVD